MGEYAAKHSPDAKIALVETKMGLRVDVLVVLCVVKPNEHLGRFAISICHLGQEHLAILALSIPLCNVRSHASSSSPHLVDHLVLLFPREGLGELKDLKAQPVCLLVDLKVFESLQHFGSSLRITAY